MTEARQTLLSVMWEEHLRERGWGRTVEAVLSCGRDELEAPGKMGWTPITLAARYDMAEVISLLLAAGADPDGKNESGDTAMHWAARENNVPMILVLVEHGADVNVGNDKGDSPLLAALEREGSYAAVEELLRLGARAPRREARRAVEVFWPAAERTQVFAVLEEGGVPVRRHDSLARLRPPSTGGRR